MTDTPRQPFRKYLTHKYSESVERLGGISQSPIDRIDLSSSTPPSALQRSSQLATRNASATKQIVRGLKQSFHDIFHRPSSAPPNMPGPCEQHEALPHMQRTQSLLISKEFPTQRSDETLTGTTSTMAIEIPSVAPASSPTLGRKTPSTPAQTTKVLVKGALGILSSAAEGIPIPGVKAVFDMIIKVIGIIEVTQANKEGFKVLEGRCRTLVDKVTSPLKDKALSEIPRPLMDSLNDLERDLTTIVADIEDKLQLSKVDHVINHEESAVIIKNINDQISHFLECYLANINTWTAMMVHEAHQVQVKIFLRQELTPTSAGFDHRSAQGRSSCFTGTRESLLADIKFWMHDLAVIKPIYVLYGIAGIGKSTVAQTVAEYASKTGVLLGSFFFSRAEDQRKSGDHFFSTLAFQFACYHEDLAAQIVEILQAVPDISQKTLDLQFQWLIVKPIQKANISQTPLVLVVDAFDECLAVDARIILELLAKHIQSMPNVKIFITTRPEPHIQRVLELTGPFQPFYLHEIETSVAKGDIELFLKYALSKSQVKEKIQVTDWQPTGVELKLLVEKCGILFIMASTAVKYILDTYWNDPATQMHQLLNGIDIEEGEDAGSCTLDQMYLNILRSSRPSRGHTKYVANFQKAVGAIIVLEDLLDMSSLSNLLAMKESEVKITLQNLHSVMAPASTSQVPQLYHKSFSDFITNNTRCVDVEFHIIPQSHHAKLSELCFSLMDKHLHQNICGLQGLQKYKANVELGNNGIKAITSELKYACLYWATHLIKSGSSNSEKLLVLLQNFASIHLLHWIEVLSLFGRLDVACPALKSAQYFLVDKNASNLPVLKEILNDGSRCVTKFYEVIKTSGGHVYYSALPFIPVESQLYKIYKGGLMDIATVFGGHKQWDPLLATLKSHSNWVRSVEFSPDGYRLASSSDDKTVKLWDGLTGAHIATMEGHSNTVTSVAFSSDGVRLASSSHDKTVKLWDGLTGTHVATFEGHSGWVRSVTFSPDGSRLASGSDDSTIKLWNGLTGACIATLQGHSSAVTGIAFSPDGSRLASSSDDTTVKLWNGLTGAHIANLKNHAGCVRSIAFSSDGSRLASGSNDKTVKLWNGFTGAHFATLQGHSDWVRSITFSSDGSRLASGSDDSTVKLWNGLTGTHTVTLEGHSYPITSVAFSSDGSRLASGSNDYTVRLWDGLTGTHIATLQGHSDWVRSIAFSPDGFRLASGSDDKTVKLWNGLTEAYIVNFQGHSDWVRSIAFSPDGFRLASGSDDKTVKLWNGLTGAHIATLQGHSDWVRPVLFSFDGSRVASGSDDSTVKLWDGLTGAHVATLEGHSWLVTSVAFSPDGSRLASGSHDKTVKLWNVLTATHIATMQGHSNTVTSVAFSSDGSRLASGSDDKTIKLWNGLTGAYIATLNGHSDWITSIAFTSDSLGLPAFLVTKDNSESVKYWTWLTGSIF